MPVRYILLTAMRDRLVLSMLVGFGLIALFSAFIGGTSLAERTETSIVYAGFATRLLVVIGVVLFTAVHVRRLIDSGELHMLLAGPVSRSSVVARYGMGLALVAAGTALAGGVACALAGWPVPSVLGWLAWCAFLVLEAVTVALLALFFALGVGSVVAAVLASLGLYVVARMLGVLLAITRSDLSPAGAVGGYLEPVVTVFAAVLPRLDLFAPTDWLIHGPGEPTVLLFLAAQALVYGALLLGAAIHDLRRRAF